MKRKIVIISDVPDFRYDVPRVYVIQQRFPFLLTTLQHRQTITEYNEEQHKTQKAFNQLSILSGVTLTHPETKLFDESGKALTMANGELLYNDGHHLSQPGALFVAPVFDEVFNKMANSSSKKHTIGLN